MTPAPDDLPDLAEAAVEGRLTDEQAARLERRVTTDPAARAFYVAYLGLHADLRLTAGGPPVAPGPRPRPGVRRAGRYALAAGVAFGFALAGWLAGRPPAAVAVLTDAPGCRWEAGSLPTAAGSPLPPGRLRLADGLATLAFASGAAVKLEGPADLELVSPMRCVLHAGRLTADVPPPAVGFVVETPTAVLTDRGTAFGVSVGEAAGVQVFSGQVDAVHKASGRAETLLTGAGRRFAPDGVRPLAPDAVADRPAEAGPPPGTRAVQLTTAGGRGKDRSVQPDPGVRHGHNSDSLLLVKRAMAGRSNWDRRAYLGFDLLPLAGRRVVSAELGLTFADTGFGFAALVPDATFAVYGLTDEALDGWDEQALDWPTAPAGGSPGTPLDRRRAERLGEFVVPQGQHAGRYALAGEPLARFLRADTDGLATLIVVRDTPGTAPDDLVHGFAGRRHPTLPPPTLRLVVADRQP